MDFLDPEGLLFLIGLRRLTAVRFSTKRDLLPDLQLNSIFPSNFLEFPAKNECV